jgi:digeranylgeranylglycerophospholipid reductase
MPETYDVIVVGAGPAGSVSAKYAAIGGARTLLLEKHPVIGYPLCCAEAISKTGLENIIKPDPKWIATKIEKAKLFSPSGKEVTVYHPDAGYVLERKIFDRWLAQQAARAGAEIRVGIDVTELLRDRDGKVVGVVARDNSQQIEILSKTVIAADGIESQIAIKAGLKTLLKPGQILSAYQYLLADIDIEPDTIEFYFGNSVAPGGYIWIFGKGDGIANVGIGICPTKSPKKKAVGYLDEFIPRRFKRYQILEKMAGGVPSYLNDVQLYKDNVLVVGDAARLVDSLTGAGIANALLSGKIAGVTVAEMVTNGIKADVYQKEFYRLKQKELKFYYYCHDIYMKLTDDDFELIFKFVYDLFDGKTVTAINPFDVVKKILLSHPRLLSLGRHLLR